MPISCQFLYVACLVGASLTAQSSERIPVQPLQASGGNARTVNAPVAPEAIYVGVGGASPGVSVIDTNGFGQGTGQLAASNWPKNPSIGQPGTYPSLSIGTSSLDAGGAGPLTLTLDQLGSPLLVDSTDVGTILDLHLGHPLDKVYNNGNINIYATGPNQINPATMTHQIGNTIMVAPHPNPPRVIFPSPNPIMGIVSEEPTVTSSSGPPGTVTTTAPPCFFSSTNQLVKGNPFGPIPGLFDVNFGGVFYGPQPPPPSPPPPPPFCPFTSRQQVGHFLYALDATRKEVVVLNSNRFTVLARIPMPDPQSMAMSPNLRWLAVANGSTGTIEFIDVEPFSQRFHRVIAKVNVGPGPTALAWQPEGEDLIVVNRNAGTLSLISGVNLRLRRTLQSRFLQAPIDVVATARQTRIGYNTGTWFAYVLNANGRIAVFESGPDSIGYDNVIGLVRDTFPGATTMQPDTTSFESAIWIAHRDSAGLGQVSRLELQVRREDPRRVKRDRPSKRGRTWAVTSRIGGFSGKVLVDLAFDDIRNNGAFPDARSALIPGLRYAEHSGKGHVKSLKGCPAPAAIPQLMFVAASDTGKVDVIDIDSGRLLRTLDTPGVTCLAHYWRQ